MLLWRLVGGGLRQSVVGPETSCKTVAEAFPIDPWMRRDPEQVEKYARSPTSSESGHCDDQIVGTRLRPPIQSGAGEPLLCQGTPGVSARG